MNITFLSLATKLATFAISASKHGGLLLNEFFIFWKTSLEVQDTCTYLKGWRSFKITAVALRPKILSRTHIQGIMKNRNLIGYIASRSDQLATFYFSSN